MATYEQSTTITSTQSSGDGLGLDRLYIRSVKAVLKIIEVVLDIIAFICAVWVYWVNLGGGWVQFVTMSAFITTLIFFFFHLFRIIYKLPGPWGLIELIYYVLYSVMLLIAGIVAAANAIYHSSIGATAFFTFAAFVVYCVDTYLLFRGWRFTSTTTRETTASATTTTSQTTYETRTQY
ncbi:hypothetical protein ACJMK2_010878 [Sinanodonta woodiana]|uniref:MARVEL domain-containing protein n=1 Tax=Sinanodonta woodiana TaxID=1069815 RepID=A0ABD3VJT8_SINWO